MSIGIEQATETAAGVGFATWLVALGAAVAVLALELEWTWPPTSRARWRLGFRFVVRAAVEAASAAVVVIVAYGYLASLDGIGALFGGLFAGVGAAAILRLEVRRAPGDASSVSSLLDALKSARSANVEDLLADARAAQADLLTRRCISRDITAEELARRMIMTADQSGRWSTERRLNLKTELASVKETEGYTTGDQVQACLDVALEFRLLDSIRNLLDEFDKQSA